VPQSGRSRGSAVVGNKMLFDRSAIMKVLIKILKIILGIVLGLVFSLLTVFCLDYFLLEDLFLRSMVSLWLIALIVAIWVFFMLWLLLLRKPSAKNIHSRGFDKLPLSVSEFIDGVIIAMKYRRSVRADVRQELTDHFTDALADCETEEEKQKATQELIEAFGDIELLGKLLRRAKKRCRPLWRTMVVRTYQFIGVCFLLLILYIGWFFTGKPQITTNYLEVMKQQVRPVADDSQNAWPFYKQAAEKYVKFDGESEDKRIDFHPTRPSPFTRSEQDRQIIQQLISDNQESLNLIRQGNQKPYYWQVYDTGENENKEMLSMLMPALADYKKLTYLMCWQGLFNAEQGDFEKAFDDILEVYSFGDHLRGQSTTIIEQLVAMSTEWTSTDILRMLLAKYGGQIDIKVLHSAQKQLMVMIADKDFATDFDSEKLFMYDEAQRCFTQSRFGKSHLYLPRLKELGALEISRLDPTDGDAVRVWIKGGLHVLFTHPDKEQTLKEVEQFYTEMEKLSILTPATVRSQERDMNEFAEEAIRKNIFLSVLMPALTKVANYSHRSRIDSEATLTILAVMQYEKEHGEYPESLDVLVEKRLLTEVPLDPFSDKPLIFRQTDNDFILYSVGYNLTDDGGTRIKDRKGNFLNWRYEGDGIFWPVDSVNSQ
jgi:hypothetical protein